MTLRNAPNFIGVGGEKTASTWIYKCLLEHPDICGPKGKELSYFDTVKIIGWETRIKSEYEKHGIEKYLEHFAHCGQEKITGEYTAQYLHDKKVAPLLRELFPEVKILISLRNPIDRTYSMYLGINEKDRALLGTFEEALKKEPEFTRRSHYAEYVAEYLTYFKREQVCIVFYDDIMRDPIGTLQKIFDFLGVDSHYIPESALQRERTAGEKGLLTLRGKLMGSRVGKILLATFRTINITPLLKSLYLKRFKKTDMKPETRERLRNEFLHDIEALEKLLTVDLTHWK